MWLAQTSQPASAWTPEAVGLYIIPAIFAGIIAVLTWRANRKADEAKKTAREATTTAKVADAKADSVQTQATTLAQQNISQGAQIADIRGAMPGLNDQTKP